MFHSAYVELVYYEITNKYYYQPNKYDTLCKINELILVDSIKKEFYNYMVEHSPLPAVSPRTNEYLWP